MLKKYLISCCLILFCAGSTMAQVDQKDLREYNGWEFIPWKTHKNDIKKLLYAEGYKMHYTQPNPKRLEIKGELLMRTWLQYDSLDQMTSVKQYEDFHVADDAEAAEMYAKVKADLIKKYGQPNEEKDDKEAEKITLGWNLKHTTISVAYDYEYKIIDELGCCSYSVEVVVEEK
jgi:hypothetical protein